MSKKSHIHDEPAPYEPPPPPNPPQDVFDTPAPEGMEAIPIDTPHPTLSDAVEPRHENLNELMAGWWKEVKDTTIHPDTAGDHFAVYAAQRGWQLVETPPAPAAKPSPDEESR